MFENWRPNLKRIGKTGSESGIILFEDIFPDMAVVTIEKKYSVSLKKDVYSVTFGLFGILVHTAFFSTLEDAQECADSVKLVIQALRNEFEQNHG